MNTTLILNKINKNKSITAFAALIFLTEFVRGAYLNFVPLYADNVLKYSIDIIGMVSGVVFLAETLAQIGVGWLLDRFNNRIILALGLIISFTALFALRFVSSPLMLVIDGAVYGFGFAPVWIIVLGYVSKFDEHKRSLSMGIVYSAWLSGLGLGTVVVSFLVGRGYFFAMNVMALIWSISVIFGSLIKEGIRKEDNHIDVKKSLVMTFNELKTKKYLFPGLFLQTLCIAILVPLIPIYMTSKNYIGLSTDSYGVVLSAIGLMTVFFMIFFGSITKKVGTFNLFAYGLFIISISILGIGNTKSTYIVLTCGLLLAVSYSAVLPAWNGILANNIRGEIRGIMWGSFSTIEGLGRSIGPLLGGIMARTVNPHFSFNISAVLLLLLALYYIYLNKRRVINKVS